MTPAAIVSKTCLLGSVLAILILCSACAQTPTTQAGWDEGYYNAVPVPISRVNAMGPSAGIF